MHRKGSKAPSSRCARAGVDDIRNKHAEHRCHRGERGQQLLRLDLSLDQNKSHTSSTTIRGSATTRTVFAVPSASPASAAQTGVRAPAALAAK